MSRAIVSRVYWNWCHRWSTGDEFWSGPWRNFVGLASVTSSPSSEFNYCPRVLLHLLMQRFNSIKNPSGAIRTVRTIRKNTTLGKWTLSILHKSSGLFDLVAGDHELTESNFFSHLSTCRGNYLVSTVFIDNRIILAYWSQIKAEEAIKTRRNMHTVKWIRIRNSLTLSYLSSHEKPSLYS